MHCGSSRRSGSLTGLGRRTRSFVVSALDTVCRVDAVLLDSTRAAARDSNRTASCRYTRRCRTNSVCSSGCGCGQGQTRGRLACRGCSIVVGGAICVGRCSRNQLGGSAPILLAAPPVGGRSLYENESVLLFALLACACVLQVDLAVAGDGRSFVLAGTESTQPTASSLLTLVETEGGVGGDESNWRVHMAPAPPASMTIRWTFPPRQQGTLYQRLCARGADAVILHELRVRDLRRLVLPDAWLNDECVNELCAALAPESVVINSQLSWVVTSKIGASQSELQKRLCKWSVKLGAAQTLSLAYVGQKA